MLAMAHSKNNVRLLHSRFHFDTVFQARRHWLLAKYMIALLSKRCSNFYVHVVLYRDEDRIS